MSRMYTAQSRMEAWISAIQSGTITPTNAVSAAGVLDMTEMVEGFALRLRGSRTQKDLPQTELGKLADLHYTHFERHDESN